jgi:rhodanese-related sulfurtransferase
MDIKLEHVFLAASLLLLGFMLLKRRGDVTPAQARKLVGEGARLVDVRSPGEFAGGHIEGAVNIPVGALGDRLGEVGPKDRPVVLYCASGARSAMAARMLKSRGYSQVRNLGAMSRW